ncbi:MAG: mechanosensitive ion channel [Magnetococcales bacterium]|nr:mechanosensitive ion channel [Magnetococcales bacterium]
MLPPTFRHIVFILVNRRFNLMSIPSANLPKSHWFLVVVVLLTADLLFNLPDLWGDKLPAWMHAERLVEALIILWWYGVAWAIVRGSDLFVWQRLYGIDTPGVPRPRRELTDIYDILVYVAITVVILVEVFHQPMSGIFATSGVMAIILGLALQNTLGDLFAGLALNIERPFKAGDWVTLDGVQGLVLFTNWRATHLRTRTADDVILPNSVVAKSRLTNHSRPTPLNIVVIDLPLRYGVNPDEAIPLLRDAAGTVEGVLANPAPIIFLADLLSGNTTWRVSVFIDDFAKLSRVRSDVNIALLKAVHAAAWDHLLTNQHVWVHHEGERATTGQTPTMPHEVSI